ncbi:MAG: RNase adapter RapZ [bacterium]|nr:RNase adapter RapZ [bacterium]
MRLIIVTGMSGAGKTTALKILEDFGFYCVDNLPIPLMEKFAELVLESTGDIKDAALGIDIRGGDDFEQLQEILRNWKLRNFNFEILFLDSGDDILIKRYKETRRSHPLAAGGRVDKGIAKEREKIAFLRREASVILDTSNLLTRELRQELEQIFLKGKEYRNLYVTVLSFGFKYGIPVDADLVFDVRFLPNPYYVDALRALSGNDREVQEYVMRGGKAQTFLEKLHDMLMFLLPNYVQEGKNQLVIAIGCTGGKHRSVTIANALYEKLLVQSNYGVRIEHRDIEKDSLRKKV